MRRTYSPELRAEALSLIIDKGKTPTEVSLVLNLPVRSVQYWHQEYRREHGIPYGRKKRPWAKQTAELSAPTQATPSVAQAMAALVEAIRNQVRRDLLLQLGTSSFKTGPQ